MGDLSTPKEVKADLEEFVKLVESGARCVYVSELPIDLKKLDLANAIFVLQLPEGFSTATGSRGGGFGDRRILKVHEYMYAGGDCWKINEFDDRSVTEILELPYHAAAFPIILPDGKEKFVSGVADSELVSAYRMVLAGAKGRGT